MGKPVTRSLSRSLNEPLCPAQTSSSNTFNIPPTKLHFRQRKIRKPSIKNITATITKTTTTSHRLSTITKPLSVTGEIDRALQHLQNSDPLLKTLISDSKQPTFESNTSPFLSLSRSILYQQLAINAAKSIYTRFLTLCGGESGLKPEKILSLSAQQLREIGVSGRKASYLHDLAEKYRNGALSDSLILEMNDEMLLTSLTAVKGIGVWSVHMFMIFSLHRPDVLPVGDLGVRKGVQSLYGLKELPQPLIMEQLCEKWRPYRSVGSWYMWRLMEAKKLASG
ncbi:alkylbase DNA glycosidase-like protein mag2 [Mercurialis annua]|uniref:alkylbase DNA glycosidase-like protein mag2 n=1 Tax=Mercurialis annua TaxID=3986 RepID=UPI002160619D|nr:alkylbase DNA glycosidase-like protein mag2 [Mercurialis annua]